MPQINATHPLFASFAVLWKQIADCIAGSASVKAAQPPYLRKPNPTDTSPENEARFVDYNARAVFYNVTGETKEKMQGQCFALDPVYTGPEALQYLIDDIDGSGVSAVQQSKAALGHVLAYSRAGLFTDYPKTDGVVSVMDAETKGIRPKVILLAPWNVINWRSELVGAKSRLVLVVMKENEVVSDDGYQSDLKERFRVLHLTNGVYSFEIWEQDGSAFKMTDSGTPTDGNGQTFDEIPFTFIGAECNNSELEKPLLLDISNLNLAHFQNSADYEEAVFMVGQPTPWASGLTTSWVDDVLKNQIQIGSRAFLPLPEGAACGLMQAEPNTLPKEAMDQKEAQMIGLGAKLTEKREVAQTATEKSLNEAAETSILAGACSNVSAAYGRNLTFAARFANVDPGADGILWELNQEFAVSRMTPQEAKAVQDLYAAGLITFEECRDKLTRGGYAYLSPEDAKDQIDEQSEKDLKAAQAAMQAEPNTLPGKGGTEEEETA